MRSLEQLVSPTVMPGYKREVVCPQLSLLAFSGTAPVTIEPNPPGPNNVIEAKDGKNPAGPQALSSVKDVLATGQYKHPVHGWSLDVTPDKMKKYCAAFSEMKANGVKVPIYADHKPGAATTLGYCRDMFMGGPDALKAHPELANLPANQAPLDPNRMYAIHDWASPEAQKMGHGVGQVSVLIDKKMKDGTGKSYGEAVRHIAVTPEPIVPGQGAFTQLAASLLELSNMALYGESSQMDKLELGGPGSGRRPSVEGSLANAASEHADKQSQVLEARKGDNDNVKVELHERAASAHQRAAQAHEEAYHAEKEKNPETAKEHAVKSMEHKEKASDYRAIGKSIESRSPGYRQMSELSRLVSPLVLSQVK